MAHPSTRLQALHRELGACRACPGMKGPAVLGEAISSRVLLVGQAPGPHEGQLGRPFAWTAGKTLFRWLESGVGLSEQDFRRNVYMAAVARCFPGKAKGGGDRRPAPEEISRCRPFLEREVALLQPRLVIPVGTLAIEQVLGHKGPLADVVGRLERTRYHGVEMDAVCLPHPSGASTWHRGEPGKSLLARALELLRAHPEIRAILSRVHPVPG